MNFFAFWLDQETRKRFPRFYKYCMPPICGVAVVAVISVLVCVATGHSQGRKKESLMFEHKKENVIVLMDFFYPDSPEGKRLSERVVKLLNSGEKLLGKKWKKEESSDPRVLLGEAMVWHTIDMLAVMMTLEEIRWVGKERFQHYSIWWNEDDGKWEVKVRTRRP